jgi:hypothetical protein
MGTGAMRRHQGSTVGSASLPHNARSTKGAPAEVHLQAENWCEAPNSKLGAQVILSDTACSSVCITWCVLHTHKKSMRGTHLI